MRRNQSIPANVHFPLTVADWERTFQIICASYLAARKDRPAEIFFSQGARNYDAHLLVAAKGVEPLYLVVVLEPLAADSLADYFLGRADEFIDFNCWGDPVAEWSWGAAGTLPAAESLSRHERHMRVALIGSLVEELMERFSGRQIKN